MSDFPVVLPCDADGSWGALPVSVSMSKMSGYGPALQASWGTVAWSDLLYDNEEDTWCS